MWVQELHRAPRREQLGTLRSEPSGMECKMESSFQIRRDGESRPNQHLKDFLKLVDSLDLDGSITTWRILTNSFPLAQFFPPGEGLQNSGNDFLFMYKSFMTMSIPSQDEPLTNRHVSTSSYLTNSARQCQPISWVRINARPNSTLATGESHNDKPKENEEEEKDSPKNIHVNPSVPPDLSILFITKKVLKLNSFSIARVGSPSSIHELVCTKGDDGDVMFIKIVKTNEDSYKEEPEFGEQEVEYFDIFPTRSELAYHKYLMCGPIPSIFLRNPIIMKGCPSNLKIPCNIGHVHMEEAYIDPNSPLNIRTRIMYNWIMKRKLDPMENLDIGVSNFTGRIKGMHVFIGNFTYIIDFMIVEDISSIIDPRLSQVVLGRPFIGKLSNTDS
ncbi:hypothetical protein Tco_0439946 [Tanacetum coccineum]